MRGTGLQLLKSRPAHKSTNEDGNGKSPADTKPIITNGAQASGSGSHSATGSAEGSTIDAVDTLPLSRNVGGEEDEDEEDMSADWKTIYRFAQSSITRGDYSIVGNSIPVLEAREVLYYKGKGRDREKADSLMRAWLKRHDPIEDDEEDVKRWICPECKFVI